MLRMERLRDQSVSLQVDVSGFIAKLLRQQGRSVDEIILAKIRAGKSVYEKVAIAVEMQEREPLDLLSWNGGTRAETSLRVRVVRRDPSWVVFQERARALRDAGVL